MVHIHVLTSGVLTIRVNQAINGDFSGKSLAMQTLRYLCKYTLMELHNFISLTKQTSTNPLREMMVVTLHSPVLVSDHKLNKLQSQGFIVNLND